MVKATAIGDVLNDDHVGETVELKGWVYRERASNKIAFLVLRDASGILQTVFKKDAVPEHVFENAQNITLESAVNVKGILEKDERAPTGYELQAENLDVVHKAERFPITEDQSTEFLMDVRHLWIRSQDLKHVMKLKHTMLQAARTYFDEMGAYEVNPPIFTPNACEGGTTLFDVDYFDDTAYLSQSAQMYLEAMIFSLENVYSLTPSFRAEKSRTARHLTEYWHLEWEGAWADNEQNMDVQQGLVQAMVQAVLEQNQEELAELGRDPNQLQKIVDAERFPRITYTEAVNRLQENGFDIEWGEDLGTKEERFLTKDTVLPLFVTNYPEQVKAFYMKQAENSDEHVVLCNDLLGGEGFGEIIGGSERETSIDVLKQRLEEEDIPLEAYDWYLDLRRFGSIPHAGFGLGVERLVRWICGLDHIRDTIPFPRTTNRYAP